jgi:DNA-binding transcriptional LysR family regulator
MGGELRLCVDEILPLASLWPHVRAFYALVTTRLRFSTEVLGGVWDALVSGRADIAIGAAEAATREPRRKTDRRVAPRASSRRSIRSPRSTHRSTAASFRAIAAW